MPRKLEEQELIGVTFARDQNDELPAVDEASSSALWRTKQFLAVCLVSEYSFVLAQNDYGIFGWMTGDMQFSRQTTVASIVKPLRGSRFAGF